MTGNTYRIEIAGSGRPHYCRAQNDLLAIRYFLRARRAILATAGRVTLSVYRYQHVGWLWAGIDNNQAAQVWHVETGAFRR